MENVNIVTITLREYNELRDFKKSFEQGDIFTEKTTKGFFGNTTYKFNPIPEVSKIYEEELERVNELLKQRRSEKIATDALINSFRRMSIWEFWKWKHNRYKKGGYFAGVDLVIKQKLDEKI